VLVTVTLRPGLVEQVRGDLARFFPDAGRMAVLEARPLFLYSGNWSWLQPWLFFRTGFYLGALGAVLLAVEAVRSRRLDHALIAVFAGSMIAATIGQNRFGYYLVPAAAVVIGWLSSRVLDWGGVPHAGQPSLEVRPVMPLQREVAVVLVAGLAVAPNLVPAAWTTTRTAGMPQYWRDAMDWLRTSTPPPFAAEDYYDQRYPGPLLPHPAYSVMNWWDQGYWIVQTARRVPVSNPTQINARSAGEFYISGDERAALKQLELHGSRYVLLDWELPFREAGGGALGGRFENLVNWAGVPTSAFYRLCYANTGSDWRPVWLFRESYFRSMAYRLMVLGGAASEPASSAWVVRTEDRVDTNGLPFCELTDRRAFPSLADARQAAESGGGQVVGMDPWRSAFPLPAITGLRQVFEARSPGQGAGEAPMVRIFQVTTAP
jgi:asparagine N-glycosylation enzyme membrane subunit Stt3